MSLLALLNIRLPLIRAVRWPRTIGLLLQPGRFGDAVAAYDRALKIRPDYADAVYHKGFALAKLGNSDDALLEFERALTENPGNAQAYTRKARSWLKPEGLMRLSKRSTKALPFVLIMLRPTMTKAVPC